ncbi:hypothetical protein GCM10011414_06960 [Croceivirga lutea]|uniref:hypothetical protein n=1 Tax=Croceivirga lutea TaxID=1775167 RepID=UPI00163AEDFC|nr:hypothetical protein [Croceivirga lutea]GGG40084.1 hypothetical protein GCM10011414_06960 [Croceivirga lutea]
MKFIYGLTFILLLCSATTLAQTAKSNRDLSIEQTRTRNLVERFDRNLVAKNEQLQKKLEKNKLKLEAIHWAIENAELKDKQKSKLKEALNSNAYSASLSKFIAENKSVIDDYLKSIDA